MRQIFATAAILMVAAGPALAQEIPEGQSCGGLFCDLGIVGHKTAPAAAAPAAPAARPAAPVVVAPAPTVSSEPRRRIVRKKRVVPETTTASAKVAAPREPKAVPVATSVAPSPAKPASPAKPPAAAPSTDEPVIFISPASQAPVLKDMFQPIYR